MLLRSASLALAASLALGAPVAMADTAPTVVAQHVSAPATQAARNASDEDAKGYASRERQDKQVADYEGGSLIVVGISATTIIGLFVLLLLFA